MLLVLAGCGSGGSTDPDASVRSDAIARDAGPLGDQFSANFSGQIHVMEGASGTAQEFFAVRAWITDRGLLPNATAVAREGDCAIFVHPEAGDCGSECRGYCDATDMCVAFPVAQSAGVITVSGLKQPLSFTPINGNYDSPFPGQELFDSGDPITVTAAGGDVAAFSASLVGVATLQTEIQSVGLEPGVDETITWTAEGSGRIQVALVVGWHLDAYEALLLCETEDSGSLTIPGTLISELPRQRTFFEPHSSTMARFVRKNITTQFGPVEVLVGSQVPISFSHYPEN